MQSTTERRQMIAEYISDHRHVHIRQIMNEFNISNATVRRDVELLACSYPIITSVGRNVGGIHAMDGWYIGRRYLHSDQEALLRELLPRLLPEQQETMQSILDAFAKPAVMV